MEKILIVDDSKTSRKFLRNMLTGAGYEVVAEAVDGIDGVEKYKEYKPDVVTMDITIMRIDPDAKIIMVTAAGQKNNVVEAIKRGAVDFVQKPFEAEAIVDVIKKAMEE